MKRFFPFLILILFPAGLFGQDIVGTNLEQARELFNQGSILEALEVVEALLRDDVDNTEALKLKDAIELDQSLALSRDLTNRALLLIDKAEFTDARELLGRALVADPGNALAMDLYVSLSQVSKAESATPASTEQIPQSSTDTAEETKATDSDAGEQIEPDDAAPVSTDDMEDDKTVVPERQRDPVQFGFTAGPRITFANSNYLSLDSSVKLLGVGGDGWFYLPYWDTRIGISAKYAGSFIKISGINAIDFATNRLMISGIFRTWLFESGDLKTTLGGRISYDMFNLNNRETLGAYLITSFTGPGAGFFISDPVVARFTETEFMRNLLFDFNIDGSFSTGPDGTLIALDIGFGTTYSFSRWGVGLEYDFYGLYLDGTSESYHGILLSGQFTF